MKKFTVWIALALLCLGALFTAGCGSDNGQKHIAMVFSHEPNRWTQGAQMLKGDRWGEEMRKRALGLLRNKLIPFVNAQTEN